MSPRLNSPPTEKVGAQENRHTTRRAHPRGTDGSNPAPSSGESGANVIFPNPIDGRRGFRQPVAGVFHDPAAVLVDFRVN